MFIFGPQMCQKLTFRRNWTDGEIIPDCFDHLEDTQTFEERKYYHREVGYLQPISSNLAEVVKWEELSLSRCPYGCKIYQHVDTGERVLAHNNSYGCDKERV